MLWQKKKHLVGNFVFFIFVAFSRFYDIAHIKYVKYTIGGFLIYYNVMYWKCLSETSCCTIAFMN